LSHRLAAITPIPALVILFGLAEAFTALTLHFIGLRIADENNPAYLSAAIGILYAAAGFLVLTTKRFAVAGAIALLALIIAGRIAMLVTGLYPVDTIKQIVAFSAGTAVAAGFTVYIGLQWHRYE
jgi:hypothetical protein